jgi:hypothetical protein
MFERPNFDAKFFSGSGGSPFSSSQVEIVIGTKDGSAAMKTVIITATGQIAIQ